MRKCNGEVSETRSALSYMIVLIALVQFVLFYSSHANTRGNERVNNIAITTTHVNGNYHSV